MHGDSPTSYRGNTGDGIVNPQSPPVTVDLLLALIPELMRDREPNRRQRDCIAHPAPNPLMIVAGPGTGKTSVLVMRALRLLLVDRILPEHILITTFTKKAAREIRTRLIDWGLPLIDALRARVDDSEYARFLDSVDINRFITGTLDSICEDVLASARQATERPPVVVEPFAANQILGRYGRIRDEMASVGDEFSTYLHRYAPGRYPPSSLGDITRAVRLLVDRFVQDRVDIEAYLQNGLYRSSKAAVVRIYGRYRDELRDSNRMDFPRLEEVVLERLLAGRVPDMLQDVRAVLVDEYQDTNPLQESLYFALVRATGASFTVVGDDDQSVYRFRGATIELFRDFARRCASSVDSGPVETLQLIENYRSRPEIALFFNGFVLHDPGFGEARVQQPPKEPIQTTRLSEGLPVLGMFRANAGALEIDLADFLYDIFRGGGWSSPSLPGHTIRSDPERGNFGDAVLLGHSVAELGSEQFGAPAPRLPMLLRQQLEQRGIAVFNPRGRALKNVPAVEQLLGLVLDVLDAPTSTHPEGRAATLALTADAKRAFLRWRASARAFLATSPRDRLDNLTPEATLRRWQGIVQRGDEQGTAREWPVLDLMYGFIPWLPQFQDDPEHQVYLEAISRCAAVAATFSSFRATIRRADDVRQASVDRLLFDVLAPIADDLVDPDEDIMPSVPRDRLNIMTIHQAKGLEFPLVIVDISSGFATNHPATKFLRFPEQPSAVALVEDDFAHCTEIGPARLARHGLARSFDDLLRLYYVAYSRPRSVLLLVGHVSTLRYGNPPRNVASFWRRDGSWAWREPNLALQVLPRPGQPRPRGAAGRMPAQADALPFTNI
jgi:DNA helicase-2/ATP-dependent DNA helicase PcrA